MGVFRYHPEKDAYTCPADEPLPFRTQDSTSGMRLYRADGRACNACARKRECTDAKKSRIVWRHFEEDFFDGLRSYQVREDYRKALRKRKVRAESLFAEAKRWHGLGRFRLRTLAKVNQAALSTDTALSCLLAEICAHPCDQPEPEVELPGPGDVVVPLRVLHGGRHEGTELAFFSTVTTFGTPLDVTVSVLAIESFFPAGPHTASALRRLP